MKYLYAIVFGIAFLLSANSVQATHQMGADMEYTCMGQFGGAMRYRVVFSFYRNCRDGSTPAVSAPTTVSLTAVPQAGCAGVGNVTATMTQIAGQSGIEVSPLCPTQLTQSGCNFSGSGNAPYPGVQVYKYEAIIDLPLTCATWKFQTTDCCRNGAINNIPNPGSVSLSIEAYVNQGNDPLSGVPYCNNSVSFTQLPVPFVCANNLTNYNHGAVDGDGDSLVYSLINPLGDNYQPIGFNAGYSASQPVRTSPANGFQFNPNTGQMTFTPGFVEADVLAVKVDEYRNGVLIGSTIRDIQVNVLTCNVSIPEPKPISSIQNGNQKDSITLQVCPGTQVSFDVNVIDPNGRNLTLKSSLQSNPSPLPGAVFSQINQGTAPNDTAIARVTWTPAPGDTGCHQFLLVAENDDCPVKGRAAKVYNVCVFNKVQLLSASPTFCGTPVQLNASGGTNFTWNPTSGLSSSTVLNPKASPTAPTWYKFTSDCGTDSVYVNVAAPFVFDAGTGGQICQNGQIQLNASVDNLYAPYSIKWSPSSGLVDPVYGLSNDSILNPVAAPLATTKYMVSFTGSNGCTNVDSVTVNVSGTGPVIQAKSDKSAVCPGQPAQLVILTNPQSCGLTVQPCDGYDITAQVGAKTDQSGNSPTQLPSPFGNYTKSTRHQMLYKANEVLAATGGRGGKIKSIAIRLMAAGTPLNNVTIKIACTSADSIIGYTGGGSLVTVYNPKNYTPVAGWNTFNFDNFYDWDGKSNLLIDICHNSSSNNGQHMKFNITRTDGGTGNFPNYRSMWFTESNSFDQCGVTGSVPTVNAARYKERPNMQFVMCVGDLSNANIAWTPNTPPNAPTPLNKDTTVAYPQTPQVYSVAVTNQNGCTGNSFVFVNVDTSTRLTMTNDTFICATNATVKLKAKITSSLPNPNYTYTWAAIPSAGFVNPGNRDSVTVTPNTTTKYYVTITGGSCTLIDSVTVSVGSGIPVSLVLTDSITCFGANNGKVSVQVPGNPPGLTYSWVPNTYSGANIQNLAPGVYAVTVTNAQACQGSDTIVVNQPAQLQLNFSSLDVTCAGKANGNITATVIGGTPNYTFGWNPSLGNTATPNSLSGGTYNLTVTDRNGCTITGSRTLAEPPALTVVVATTNATSNGGNEGTAKAIAAGGNPGYTYVWNTGATGDSISNLSKGNYCVTITDANSCTASACDSVKDPPPIILTFAKTDVLCFGDSSGSAQVSAVGGILPYSYKWSSNPLSDTTNAITNVKAGVYTVTVTDSAGVAVTGNITITSPTAIAIVFDSIPISCNGGNNGALTAIASGGTPNYIYAWIPGNLVQQTIQGLSSGTYTVLVSDANNCTATATYFLAEPTPLVVSVSVQKNVFCYGGSDGAALAQASGGTPNYTFVWSNSVSQSNTDNILDLTAGNQTLIVTDAHGCTDSANFAITQPPLFGISVTTTNANCPTSNDGSATGTITGGSAPYVFSWDGNTGPQTQTGLTFGNHSVTVTDQNQCTATANFYIDTNYVLRVDVQPADASCFGVSNGSVVVTPQNGTPNFTFNYANALGGTANPAALASGSYVVSVTDNLNCVAIENFVINQPDEILLTLTGTDPLCRGEANGTVTVAAVGGTPGYTYVWSDSLSQQTTTASGLVAGNYTVTVTDINQCTQTGNVGIADPTDLQLSFLNRKEISCAGNNDASITVQGEGGTPPYIYAWAQNNFVSTNNSDASLSNLGPDVYSVTITDKNGCSISDTVVFSAPPDLGFNYIIIDSASCPGYADGKLRMLAQGGTPGAGNEPYLYSINNVTYQASGTFTDLVAGDYRVYVKDGNGCMYDTLVTVPQPYPLNLQILPQDSTIDLGNSIVLNAVTLGYSGSDIKSYNWSPTTGLNCFDCSAPTATPYNDIEYTLTVFYLKKCSAEQTVNVYVGDGNKFFIPNLISPNGDGANDVWEIYGYDLQTVRATIFNRWGEKIFDSDGSQFSGWDGTYKGVKQEPGIYTYYIKAIYLNGKVVEKAGTITLVR